MPRTEGKKNPKHTILIEKTEVEAVAFIGLFTVLYEIFK